MSGGNWKDMYSAAECGNLELVRYHLTEGVDPNYQHPEIMYTALFASIQHGHEDIVALLVAQGADPSIRVDFKDMNAWQTARYFKRMNLLAVLGDEPKVGLSELFLKAMQKPFQRLFYY